MDKKIRYIPICEEDICNLQDCIEKTKYMWEPFHDLWPFTVRDIIKRYTDIIKKETYV